MTAAGISTTTAQARAMAALLAAAGTALANERDGHGEKVAIGFGFRWPIIGQDWLFGTETTSDIEAATVGPRRTLDEQITLTVTVGSWAPYDPDADVATESETLDRAFYLLGLVQDYIRTQDITLGGTVLWCLPGSSNSATDSDVTAGIGRVTEITATFVCKHRIATA